VLLEVVCVGSRDVEKARAFVEVHCPGAKALGSYDEVLRSEDVDAVYGECATGDACPLPATIDMHDYHGYTEGYPTFLCHGVVPLPAACHVEWVVKAASCGKHVLLEKPIAVTAADADVMVRACEEHGVQLMDG
jgi:predicted dehydrogenase